MKRLAIFLFLALLATAVPAWAQIPKEIIEKAASAVVVIYSDDEYPRGTGFMFNDRGDVLTNYHVCSNCPRLWVRLRDGRAFEAVRIYVWEYKDMAILRLAPDLSGDRKLFSYIALNETSWITPGSSVATIGHSKYGNWQVIQGYVKSGGYYVKYQPTILYGFSGGHLINEDGDVVGLNIGSYNPD